MAFIPAYLLILAFTITIDYFVGIYLEKIDIKYKKLFLIISLISNCGILFIFKYFNFFNANLAAFANLIDWNYPISSLNIILPIGLSFHTFQSMSYIVEVYRGKQKAEKNFGIFALYVMFYPQLVAGPIERPQNLLHQFREEHHFDYKRVTDGLKLMTWGLFKKVVIADRLALMVNQVYNNPTDYQGFTLIVATIFFAFEIYCDFSGYSDIAIGAAQVMGFKLMKNFDRPYFAKSISEFWKRWHISLSTWFRDYLYIPLGGNRANKSRVYFNLFIVFLVSGLWHGANWTYVIWGALHGIYLITSIVTKDLREKFYDLIGIKKFPSLYKCLQISITFTLVCFAWIFFRANSVNDAFYIVTHLFTGIINNLSIESLISSVISTGFTIQSLVIALIMITIMEIVHLLQRSNSLREIISQKPTWFRWAAYYSLVLLIILFGVFNQSKFIYFQF